MSAPTPGFPLLQKIRFFMIAFLLSNLGLVIGRAVPDFFPGEDNPWNTITSYVVTAGIYLFLIVRFCRSNFNYFGRPRFDWKAWVAVVIAGLIAAQRVNLHDLSDKSVWTILTGALFLLSIGLGEEFVSRGFVYGIFERFGKKFAFLLSSILFGLLHLGWYMGAYWDPWAAYWHVFNAFAAGLFLCALMIATRSIWPAVLMHAVWDWRLAFNSSSVVLPKPGHITHAEFWSGLISPIWGNAPLFLLSALLLSLRWFKAPGSFEKLLLKFKLIEVD
jgi:membrane protease YdiL (CAAX protease family)